MPINLCTGCGRITGYRHCPWCKADTIRQMPPFTKPMQTEKPASPIRVRIFWDFLPPLKAWRRVHQQKIAARRVSYA